MSGDARASEDERVLLALRRLKARVAELEGAMHEPIAIVGMACRLPGQVCTPEQFWQLLASSSDAIEEIPRERWDVAALYDPNPQQPGKMTTRWGGFLADVSGFDAALFDISPIEARNMDPQQRLLLEVSWEAFERAGYAPDRLEGSRTAVFVGVTSNDYARLQTQGGDLAHCNPYTATGNSLSLNAGRLSYVFGLKGPAVTLDTSCSSALVGVHLACQALRLREATLALAAGVNVILTPDLHVSFSQARMMAPDGRCKTFDASANGYVRGEGCGVVVLKRLTDALADGDNVLAVIRGSAVNQDGPSSGLTVPSGPAQEEVIRAALSQAGLSPADVGYVEAHGTGTALGDPIEVQALANALGAGRSRATPLLVGSVKSNIGHLEAAAGAAGLIKVVLALQHETIPASLHVRELNRFIAWDDMPIAVATVAQRWPRRAGGRRIAGVSSFGFSGTNAHVLIEEASLREVAKPAAERPLHVFCLSAPDRERLQSQVGAWREHLTRAHAADSLADLCFTANTGRRHFSERLAIVARSLGELGDGLLHGHRKLAEAPGSRTAGAPLRIAFRFAGAVTAFSDLRPLTAVWPLIGSLLDEAAIAPALREAVVTGTAATQERQVTVVRQWLCARLLIACGVNPEDSEGEGVGALAAAALGGRLTLARAVELASADSAPSAAPAPAKAGVVVVAFGAAARPAPGVVALDAAALGWDTLAEGLAQLYRVGAELRWEKWDEGLGRQRVVAPTTIFRHQRYWVELERAAHAARQHPLLGRPCRPADDASKIVFEDALSADRPRFLADHRIFGRVIFPGAGFVELALAATGAAGGALRELSFERPLALDHAQRVQTIVASAGDERQVTIYAAPSGGGRWAAHARARVGGALPAATHEGLASLRARFSDAADVPAAYAALNAQGLEYGPELRTVEQAWRGEGEAFGAVRLAHDSLLSAEGYVLHPALLDGCFHLLGLAGRLEDVAVPVSIAELSVVIAGATRVWCHAQRHASKDATQLIGDLRLFDDAGQVVASALGIRLRRVTRDAIARATQGAEERLYVPAWRKIACAPRPAAGRWLVVGAKGELAKSELAKSELAKSELARSLSVALERRAGQCVVVSAEGDARTLAHAVADELRRGPLQGIVVDCTCGDLEAERVLDEARRVLEPALVVIQATAANEGRVTLVTRGAVPADDQPVQNPLQSMVWGLARAASRERPDRPCACIDLPPFGDIDGEALLAALLLQAEPGPEPELALRGGAVFALRIVAGEGEGVLPLPVGPYQLRASQRGSIDNLELASAGRTPPASGEVEVRVHATGLNFRDVLNVLGMYPGDAGALGGDFSGEIVAVGAGVDDLSVGDLVVGMSTGAFASFVRAPAALVHRLPAKVDAIAAATIPSAFLTAHYGLNHLARVQRGERVLVHAGAGGVGLAAIRVCQQQGAEIFATAGSAEKRAYLRALGVEHVFDSRSLAFADQVRQASGGAGVDVVLNSLSGEFIAKSFSLLRAGGRFLEIGKTDIWSTETAATQAPRVAYFVIAMDDLGVREPKLLGRLFHEVLSAVASGALQPLPVTVFPIAQAKRAFSLMARAKHIGKVVVTASAPADLRADASYLVTGGLGALGLETAALLMAAGARHLALLGRHAPSAAASKRIDELRREGVAISVGVVDVSDDKALAEWLVQLRREMPPLRGIVHAAGMLDDGLLPDLDWPRFERVLRPKLLGLLNLHRATHGLALDFFVAYSSLASLLGAPGQANYAAANAFMDGFMLQRAARGQAALSIAWGPWADIGMATRHQRAWRGIEPLPVGAATGLLRKLLPSVGQALAAAIDGPALAEQLGDDLPRSLSELVAAVGKAPGAAAMLETLRHAPFAERHALLVSQVSTTLAGILALDVRAVSASRLLLDHGVDSLMAVELRNRLSKTFGVALSASVAVEHPTIEALAQHLLERLAPSLGADSARQASEPAPESAGHDGARLVRLRNGRRARPLFFVHGGNGMIFGFAQLARLLEEVVTTYAFQPHDDLLDGRVSSIEQWASAYVALLRSVQPQGPYDLCGYSVGGVLAFEMARQLRAAGEASGLLVAIDSVAPPRYTWWSEQNEAALRAFVAKSLGQLTNADAALERKAAAFLVRCQALFARYRPTALAGEMCLLKADAHDVSLPPDVELGWSHLVQGGVRIVSVPGNHFSIMDEPQLGRIAENLRPLIVAVQGVT